MPIDMMHPPEPPSAETRRMIELYLIGMRTARLYDENPGLDLSQPTGWERVWEPYFRRRKGLTPYELFEDQANKKGESVITDNSPPLDDVSPNQEKIV